MTNEEREKAIEGLKKVKSFHNGSYGEYIDIAIKALEAQPFINKPCVSEGVCREDKIQVLDKIRAEIIELRSKQNVGVIECLDIIDKYREGGESR